MKILVLGAGLVGSAIIRDLAREDGFSVTAADVSQDALDRLNGLEHVTRMRADLSDPAKIRELAGSHDLVAGALPGFMGYAATLACIEAGRDVVDISFFPEDSLALDTPARERGVTAIVDCGIAPGCSNAILGHADAEFDRTRRFLCYVGGLPAIRRKPWEYAAVFSPADVLEEYTRPARYVESGRLVTVPALTDVEHLDFDGVGTLEAFNTDGLRTLAFTINAPDMKEKTLRYPGHADLIRALRDTGFLDTKPVRAGDACVRPIDLSSAVLFPAWKLPEGEQDLTVMRVIVEGEKGGESLRRTFDLLDRYDTGTRTTSMARTTGYTCAVAVRLVASGLYKRPGVSPPEYLGRRPEIFQTLLKGLEERSVVFRERVESITRPAGG